MLGPIARFNETIERCYRLIDHHRQQSSVGRPGQHLADVLRGTVVLVCAGLDALNEELLVRALPVAQQRGLLTGAQPTTKAASALLADLRRVSGPSLGARARTHLRLITVQSPKAIEEYVVNVLGAQPPWIAASGELSRTAGRPWTAHEVRDGLTALVNRRNAIVHDGDLRASGRTQSIRRGAVEADVLLTYEVGHAVRAVIRQRL